MVLSCPWDGVVPRLHEWIVALYLVVCALRPSFVMCLFKHNGCHDRIVDKCCNAVFGEREPQVASEIFGTTLRGLLLWCAVLIFVCLCGTPKILPVKRPANSQKWIDKLQR